MRASVLALLSMVVPVSVLAQSGNPSAVNSTGKLTPAAQASVQQNESQANEPRALVVPAGTKVLLQLKSPIDTKSAKVGDGVYCQTSFPVTQDNIVVIPAGTYVKGEIAHVERAGRIKGRAQILFHFNSMIFPNGYTVDLPGALKSQPGARNSSVADEEGTVKADSQKGKDVGTVATTGATGAVVGTVATRTGRGAAIGGLAGAAVGLGEVLFTRGQDVHIEQGTSLEMVLQRPLTVEVTQATPAQAVDNDIRPRITNGRRLQPPKTPQ
jgi:type IV secretion system protein VirB10